MVFGLSNEIKVKITSDKDCLQTVNVEMPLERVRELIDKAYSDVQSRAKLPGFRPGKTPIEMIKKTYQNTALAQAQEDLLREGVSEAIKQKKIPAVQTPVIQSMEFNPDKPFQFQFQVEVAPRVKPSGYAGLKLTKTPIDVSQEQVDKALNGVAEMQAKIIESDKTELTKESFAVIDYEASIDGKSLPGGKTQNFLIDLSAPQTIPGLAEGLIGMKVGEEKEIAVEFPKDTPAKDLAEKKALFKVKLNAIKEKKIPSLDDELAKDLGMSSVDDLKKRISENIQAENERKSRQELEQQITDKILELNKFPLPPGLLKEQASFVEKRFIDRLVQQGIGPKDAEKATDSKKPDLHVQAEKDLRLAYLLDAIAESEKITVDNTEVDKRINEILDRSHPTERNQLEKSLNGELKGRIFNEIRETKVYNWIIEHAKVKEK